VRRRPGRSTAPPTAAAAHYAPPCCSGRAAVAIPWVAVLPCAGLQPPPAALRCAGCGRWKTQPPSALPGQGRCPCPSLPRSLARLSSVAGARTQDPSRGCRPGPPKNLNPPKIRSTFPRFLPTSDPRHPADLSAPSPGAGQVVQDGACDGRRYCPGRQELLSRSIRSGERGKIRLVPPLGKKSHLSPPPLIISLLPRSLSLGERGKAGLDPPLEKKRVSSRKANRWAAEETLGRSRRRAGLRCGGFEIGLWCSTHHSTQQSPAPLLCSLP
jgi:hypothetical protein